ARLQIVQLPTYSPDYNPIEKLWKKIKQQDTHLHYFPTFEALTEKVEQALLNFTNAPEEILARIGKINGIFAPVSVRAHPRRPHPPAAAAPRWPGPCACRSAGWRGGGGVSRVRGGRGPGHGWWWQAGEGRRHTAVPRLRTHGAEGTTPRGVDGGAWA